MAEIKFKGNPVHTSGNLPELGSKAPNFKLTNTNLQEVSLSDFSGKRVVLNIFPSVDTGICAASVRRFNELAGSMENTAVVNVSKDLPFAHKRFCGAEGIENVVSTSSFRDPEFSSRYGVEMVDGPLAGLMSRAVVVLNENGEVTYTEQVPDITQEPDYESALNALK